MRSSMSDSLRFDTNQSRDHGDVQMRSQQLREVIVGPTARRVLIFDSNDLERLKTFTLSNFVQEMPAELWGVEQAMDRRTEGLSIVMERSFKFVEGMAGWSLNAER
jgi:hypothetical protein